MLITLRVLDGADRGRVFECLPTPITIGREEGNSVQLNDERVSRYHLKIQEDDGKIVLTDLESTNGTKINGEHVKVWLLRYGDTVSLGRSTLLYGAPEEIAERLASLRGVDLSGGVAAEPDEIEHPSPILSLESEFSWGDDADVRRTLHTLLPPELPDGLSPRQMAQFSELLQYLHLRLRSLVQSVKPLPHSEQVALEARQCQNLLDLHARIARYLKEIGEPEV